MNLKRVRHVTWMMLLLVAGTSFVRGNLAMRAADLAAEREKLAWGQWIAGDATPVVDGSDRDALLAVLDELIQDLATAEPDSAAIDLLVSATDFRIANDARLSTARPYRNAEDQVNVGFVTWSSANAQSPPGDVLGPFNRFASRLVGLYSDSMPDGSSGVSYDRAMAIRLGIGSADSLPVVVPWFYLGNDAGHQVTFPATDITADLRGYDPRGRPWYEAVYGPAPRRNPTDLGRGYSLTHAYADVSPYVELVRTVVRPFAVSGRQYILGVDLEWAPPTILTRDGSTLPGTYVLSVQILTRAADWSDNPAWTAVGLVLSGGLLTVLFLVGLRSDEVLAAELRGSQYATSTRSEVREAASESQTEFRGVVQAGWEKVGASVSQEAVERSKHSKRIVGSTTTTIDPVEDPHLRGHETWRFELCTDFESRVLGVRLGWSVRRALQTAQLTFSGAMNPDVQWERDAALPLEDHVKERAEQMASAGLETTRGLSTAVLPMAELPKLLRDLPAEVMEAAGLSRPTGRRVTFRDGIPLFQKAYPNIRVRAVVKGMHLRELLATEEAFDFFLLGDEVDRVVLCRDAREWEEIRETHSDTWSELVRALESKRNHQIHFAIPKDGAHVRGFLEPDFALLGYGRQTQVLAVTEDAFQQSEFLIGTGGRGKQSEKRTRVTGYASWRPADLRFYELIWSRIYRMARRVDGRVAAA